MIEGEEKQAALKEFIITFGFGQRDRAGRPLDRCFTRVPAATKEEAREAIIAARGMNWSFIYDSADMAGVIRHRLTEVPLQEEPAAPPATREAQEAYRNRYRDAVVAIGFAANMLAFHDLEALLDAIERAESLGPILDPTLYQQKAAALREDKELVRSALSLWKLGKALVAAREAKRADRAAKSTETAAKE